MKKYEDLTIQDDFMFCKVFSTELDLTKELLERILNVKIKKVELVETQRTVGITPDGKSVRFDVYVEDERDSVYDIEMQAALKGDLRKRSRYYQGMIDLDKLEKGVEYGKLNKSFIIFICTFDLFGKGLPVYTFENRCLEEPGLPLNDGTAKVFVNATGNCDNAALSSLLAYITKGEVSDAYTERIAEAVKRIQGSEKWRLEFMTLQMKLDEVRAEGRVEGSLSERKNVIRNAFQNSGFTVAKLAAILGFSEEEVEAALRSEPSLL